MYNKTPDGYPAPGAPVGLNISIDGKKLRVCLLCAQMFISVTQSEFFRDEHSKWVKEMEHRKKLRSGSNYLDRKD
jgi:hypothetical protein